MPQQGKALTIEQKQMIVTLKHFFDKENQDSGSMYTTEILWAELQNVSRLGEELLNKSYRIITRMVTKSLRHEKNPQDGHRI
jgi:hypothetical protein